MDHIGIDGHKREGQIYLLAQGGEVIEQRIRTEPERFAAGLGTRPRARILIPPGPPRPFDLRDVLALEPKWRRHDTHVAFTPPEATIHGDDAMCQKLP